MELQAHTSIGIEAFREAAAHFASGVTVITTAVEGRLYGTTVSAVLALSEEPPMMLACLKATSSTHDAIIEAGVFGINILAEDQGPVARQFGQKTDDKFSGIDVRLSEHGGVPVLNGALASIVCRVDDRPRGGTHSVFFGTALEAQTLPGRPLAYFSGSFGRLERLREQDAYTRVRRMVLEREVAIGAPLRADQIAEQLEGRTDDVHNALVKLSTESLVERNEAGHFTPVPITVELSASLYDARANIEIGVIANHIHRIPEATMHELCTLVDRMADLRATAGKDAAEFLALHTEYHTTLVALSGSTQLLDSYRRLSIAGVWRSVWSEMEWQEQLDQKHLKELNDALAEKDMIRAVASVRAYSHQAKEFARIAIGRRGGYV